MYTIVRESSAGCISANAGGHLEVLHSSRFNMVTNLASCAILQFHELESKLNRQTRIGRPWRRCMGAGKGMCGVVSHGGEGCKRAGTEYSNLTSEHLVGSSSGMSPRRPWAQCKASASRFRVVFEYRQCLARNVARYLVPTEYPFSASERTPQAQVRICEV